jgi:EAL domain-containing protein (putative c-di-GMP-specific phosphodiesterase class I)
MPLLDQWVIRKAVEALRDTSRQVGFAPMSLAVNLSGQSLSDERLRALVIDELYALGELASCLCFEITESAAIGNLTEAQDFIAEARRFGCRFSLDDFGSGLSSFAYLQKFDIDYLKIDGAFVRRIANDPIAASMVSAINQIGQVMGLKTIAEFAENSAIVDELIRIGVDHAQGYHFGRPRPLGELLQEQIRTVRAASG